MATRKSSTLRTANVHTFKHNVTNAHRVLRMMNNPETPRETRAALRAALKRLAACTDVDRRKCLRVENIAVLLRVGVVYQDGSLWQKAHRAHRDLWEAFNERDRVENPRAWASFDEARRAYARQVKRAERRRARRAERPRVMESRLSLTLRAAA